MLRAAIPDNLVAEREYVLRELIEFRLGVPVAVEAMPRTDTELSFDGRRISIADGFFASNAARWLEPASLPAAPETGDLPEWIDDPRVEPGLPFLPRGGEAGPGVVESADGLSLHIDADLLGSAFFMLSRYEELAQPDRDQFGRFPAQSSYAFRHGFLDRPVVDEYVALLEACIRRSWPAIALRRGKFRVEVSHDVDLPLRFRWSSPARMLAGGLRQFARDRSARGLADHVATWHAVRNRNEVARDPYNTFDLLFTESERRGLRSSIYFIAERPAGNLDALYEIDDPFIEGLIGTAHRRGHEIGLHASFNSYLSAGQTLREFERLMRVCERQRVRQDRWGGRQHYLRWAAPQTWLNWDSAGLAYDSTVTYAQCAGFRCGTSFEFHPFDLAGRRTLKLLERPLVAMESSVISYMGQGTGDRALGTFLALKNRCRRHGGVFSLLWHNSNFTTQDQWDLYLGVLDG